MRKYGISRPIHIIPNLIDTNRFVLCPKPPRVDDDYHLLFVGRLNTDQKNLPALLRAMSLLAHKNQNNGKSYRLKISGDFNGMGGKPCVSFRVTQPEEKGATTKSAG